MLKIKSCLFDLDGVLVDTARFHYLAWKRLCNELGFDLSEEENEELKGISRVKSMNILLEKGDVSLSEKEVELFMEKKNQWYLEYVDAMKPGDILPGALQFLKDVKSSGRKLALGSASKNARRILEKVEILQFFDAIIDGTRVYKGKPDPQTFLFGAEATDTHPSKCVVIEDSVAGIEAGIAAGSFTIGIGREKVLNRANIVIPGFEKHGIEILEQL